MRETWSIDESGRLKMIMHSLATSVSLAFVILMRMKFTNKESHKQNRLASISFCFSQHTKKRERRTLPWKCIYHCLLLYALLLLAPLRYHRQHVFSIVVIVFYYGGALNSVVFFVLTEFLIVSSPWPWQ